MKTSSIFPSWSQMETIFLTDVEQMKMICNLALFKFCQMRKQWNLRNCTWWSIDIFWPDTAGTCDVNFPRKSQELLTNLANADMGTSSTVSSCSYQGSTGLLRLYQLPNEDIRIFPFLLYVPNLKKCNFQDIQCLEGSVAF